MLVEEHGLSNATQKPSVSAGVAFLAFVAVGAIQAQIPILNRSIETARFTVTDGVPGLA